LKKQLNAVRFYLALPPNTTYAKETDIFVAGRELKNGNELSGGDYLGIVNVGLIKDPEALLFNFETFDEGISVHQTFFGSSKIIVAGSQIHQFIVAFIDNTGDPNIQFYPLQNQLPVIMEDSHGNRYDLTGLVVSGPNEGTRLLSPDGYFAHSFAWELFFEENIEMFDE